MYALTVVEPADASALSARPALLRERPVPGLGEGLRRSAGMHTDENQEGRA